MTEVSGKIRELLEILGSRIRRMEVMTEELQAARKEVATPRMTDIADALADQDDESLIEPGQMVVTITRDGFIKRTPLETFRAQNRGGRGRTGASTRGDDIVTRSFNAHTHQWGCSSPRAARRSGRRCGGCRRPARRAKAERW